MYQNSAATSAAAMRTTYQDGSRLPRRSSLGPPSDSSAMSSSSDSDAGSASKDAFNIAAAGERSAVYSTRGRRCAIGLTRCGHPCNRASMLRRSNGPREEYVAGRSANQSKGHSPKTCINISTGSADSGLLARRWASRSVRAPSRKDLGKATCTAGSGCHIRRVISRAMRPANWRRERQAGPPHSLVWEKTVGETCPIPGRIRKKLSSKVTGPVWSLYETAWSPTSEE